MVTAGRRNSKKAKVRSQNADVQNYYLGGASECVVDKQGRILIPPLLRKYAELKRDVVLVSALEKFRVWISMHGKKYSRMLKKN